MRASGAVPAWMPRTSGSFIPFTKANGIPIGGPPLMVHTDVSAAPRLGAVSAPEPHMRIVSLAAAIQPEGASSNSHRAPEAKVMSAAMA